MSTKTVTRNEIRELEDGYRVGFSVRCASRLRPLFALPHEVRNQRHHLEIVDQVLDFAQEFAGGIGLHDDHTSAAGIATTMVYYELAMQAKDLCMKSPSDHDDLRALSQVYDLAGDYLFFAVAAEKADQGRMTIKYEDDLAFLDYQRCANLWDFEAEADAAARADYTRLRELQDQANDLVKIVPESFFHLPLWPNGEPANWSRVMERHRRVVDMLGQEYAGSREVLEVFEGFVERIDGDDAFVSLKPEVGQDLLVGRYSAKKLAKHGILERRRFRCVTVDLGTKVDVELESISDKEISGAQQDAIRREIREALGGDDNDADG